MTFAPDSWMPNQGTLGSDVNYAADAPFDRKQAVLSTRRHRWFDPRPLNVAAGQTLRIQFDNRPDFIEISISGQTVATGRCLVYMGEVGGNGIGPCGPGADVVMPAPHDGVVNIVNIGSTATIGVALAVGGYSDPGVKISLGS